MMMSTTCTSLLTVTLVVIVTNTANSVRAPDNQDIVLVCPDGWVQIPPLPSPHCYKLFQQPKELQDAHKLCETYGANLLNVFGYQEGKEVAETVVNSAVTRWWTGLNTRSGFASYGASWTDGNSGSLTQGFWDNQNPTVGSGDMCVTLGDSSDLRLPYDYTFQQQHCREQFPFVCEVKACLQDHFRCADGSCIFGNYTCDKQIDCEDASDELDCMGTDSLFPCSEKHEGASGSIDSGNPYRANSSCIWTIVGTPDTFVEISFTRLDTEKSVDKVDIYIGSPTELGSILLISLSGAMDVADIPPLYSSNNFMIVKFYSDSSIESAGFKAQWTTVAALLDAGRDLTATSAEQWFTSPLYRRLVPAGLREVWTITTGTQASVTLMVNSMSLGPGAYVEIRDGDRPDDRVLARFDEDSDPDDVDPMIIISTTNTARVYFHSEMALDEADGFNITYLLGCDVVVTAAVGIIRSPGYPDPGYGGSLECSWTITNPDDRNLALTFNDVQLADDGDTIVTYDGSNVSATEVSRGSGTLAPPLAVSTGNTLYVRFTSSAINHDNGFMATFAPKCNDPDFDLTTTIITDPDGDPAAFDYTLQVNVSCVDGYILAQEAYMDLSHAVITCGIGGWETEMWPECEPRCCGAPPVVDHGYVATSTGSTFGETVMYGCFEGFLMGAFSSENITCGSDGSWSVEPVCQPAPCGALSDIDNGNYSVLFGDGDTFGTIALFACDEGYEVSGVPLLLCEDDGTWSQPIPSCQPRCCQVPDILNGMVNISEGAVVGDTITVTCVDGFRAIGPTAMLCGTNREADQQVHCDDIDECTDTPSVCSTVANCTNTIGSYECDCFEGYLLNENDTSVCDDIDECADLICDSVNGNCVNTDGSYHCTCNKGFDLFTSDGMNGYSIAQTESGLLDGDVYHLDHTCVRTTCIPPDPVDNGAFLNTQTVYRYEDTLNLLCDIGYEANDTTTVTCGSGGLWNGTLGQCLDAECIDPDISGLTYPPDLPPSPVNYGDMVTLTCSQRRPTPLDLSRECVYDSNTQTYTYALDTDLECPVVDCGTPPVIENGQGVNGPADNLYSSSFEVICDATFEQQGTTGHPDSNNTVWCGDRGVWEQGDFVCVTSDYCKDPGLPGSGCLDRNITDNTFTVGAVVTYFCTCPGYTLNLTGVLECLPDLTWDNPLPACEDTEAPVFMNCDNNMITISPYSSFDGDGIPFPNATDNSNVLKRFDVTPPSIYSSARLTDADSVTVNITAEDFAGNSALCSFTLSVAACDPPTITVITCPGPQNTTTFDTPIDIAVDYGSLVTSHGTVTYSPVTHTFTGNDVGSFIVVTATASIADNTPATCVFTITPLVAPCGDESIAAPLFGSKDCAVDYHDCLLMCDPGYYFTTDNTGLTAIEFNCTGSDWSPYTRAPDCVLTSTATRRTVAKIEYDITAGTCVGEEENITSDLGIQGVSAARIMTMAANNPLAPALQGDYVFDGVDLVEVQGSKVYAYMAFLPQPADTTDTGYTNFIDFIYNTLFTTAVHNMELEPPWIGTCNLSVVVGTKVPTDSVCPDNNLLFVGPAHICMPCAAGSYYDNSTGTVQCTECPVDTYQNETAQNFCYDCPPGTMSDPFSKSSDDCIGVDRCGGSPLMHDPVDMWNGDYPKCEPCPSGEFWMTDTSCGACAAGSTIGSQGGGSSADCYVQCTDNDYFATGLDSAGAPCTECPPHFTADGTNHCCVECAADETRDAGSTAACASSPGVNDCTSAGSLTGTDRQDHDTFYCDSDCSDGFFGPHCDVVEDFCASNPCYYNGSCTNSGPSYMCNCPEGTTGSDCETKYEECTDQSCLNGGVCEEYVNTYICHCLEGFSGIDCEEAAADPCNSTVCVWGTCVNESTWAWCDCDPGYTGQLCDVNIDECASNPCLYGGNCTDLVDGYTCDCESFTSGLHCEMLMLCSPDTCGTTGQCVMDYTQLMNLCVCSDGFAMDPSTVVSGSWTENIETVSYGQCMMTDPCEPDPCLNSATCTNSTFPIYSCECSDGFTGSLCQHDIDDCDPNPCLNDGACVDGIDTYTCNCAQGWEGATCEEDINECNITIQCSGAGDCINMNGTFDCHCYDGYTGRECETDIDECAKCPCLHNATCVDLVDAYNCTCPAGYQGQHCEQIIDTCYGTGAIDPCMNGALCRGLFDDTFCECQGATFGQGCSQEPTVCDKFDFCQGRGNCSDSDNGTLACECSDEYSGECCAISVNLCERDGYCQNGGTCVATPDGFVCQCTEDYEGDRCELSADDCADVVCAPGAVQCVDQFFTAFCLCEPSFVGENCTKVYDPDFTLYFYWRTGANYATTPSPFVLNSAGLSVGLWVRFGQAGGTGTIFTLYAFSDIYDPSADARILMTIDHEKVALYFDESSSPMECPYSTLFPVNGAENYDHILVNWDSGTGQVAISVNTIVVDPFLAPYATGITLPQYGMVVLGVTFDISTMAPDPTVPGFFGKLSMLNVWSRPLTIEEKLSVLDGPLSVPADNDLLLGWSEFQLKGGVFPERPNTVCIESAGGFPSCGGDVPVRIPPTITCPSDPFLVPSEIRETLVTWPEPTIDETQSVFPPVALYLNDQLYLWGRYRNAYVVYDAEAHATLCTFDFFVQPLEIAGGDTCVDPKRPPTAGSFTTAAEFPNYEIAIPECNNKKAFSVPTPAFYTCGPQGVYNVDNMFLEFTFPACVPSSPPKVQVRIIVLYANIDNCNILVTNSPFVRLIISINLQTLNDVYGGAFCGGADCCRDDPCTTPVVGITVVVTCSYNTGGRRRLLQADQPSVLILFDGLPLEVCNVNGTCLPTTDVLRDYLLDLLSLHGVANGDPASADTSVTFTQLCPEPQTVLVDGSCVVCAAGQYYDAANDTCQFCTIGYYNHQLNQTECTACPSGNTTELRGAESINACYANCSAGYKNLHDKINCDLCGLGFFQPLSGQFFCQPCQVGWTTVYENSTSVDDCFDVCPFNGTEIQAVNETCINCTVGTFRTVGLQHMCAPCPPDRTTPTEGSVSLDDCTIKICTRGYFYNQTLNECFPCPVGSYMDMMWHQEDTCVMCTENDTTLSESTTTEAGCRFYCVPGYEEDVTQNETCTPCQIGFYKETAVPLDRCVTCGHYTTPDIASDNRVEDCTIYNCGPGNQPTDTNDACEECPLGTYQPEWGQVACLACDNGTSTRMTGADTLTMCEVYCDDGYEEDTTGACVPCQIGYYKDNDDGLFSPCTLCDIAYITAGIASESVDSCVIGNCTEGEYLLPNNTCADCPRGTYQDLWWQANCTDCGLSDTGREQTTGQTGSKVEDQCILDCPSGMEFDGSDNCEDCDIGYYRTRYVEDYCTLCDVQYITENMGSESADNCTIKNCSAGYFRHEAQNVCFECPQGTFQSEKWQTECNDCNDTFTTWTAASRSSSDCILEDSCAAGRDNCTEDDEGGICTFDQSAPGWFVCSCQRGFQGDGTVCTHLCDLGYCMNGGTCNDTVIEEPTCICPEFYTGAQCETREVPPSKLPIILGGTIGGFLGLLAFILLTVLFCWCCQTPAGAATPLLMAQNTVGPTVGPTATHLGPVADKLYRETPSLAFYKTNKPTETTARSVAGYSNFKDSKPKYLFYEDTDTGPKLGPGIKYNSGNIYNNNGDQGPYNNYSSRVRGNRS